MCSDHTSGGRGENDDILISDLECAVTTDPEKIAAGLQLSGVNVVFCTYQSLDKVSEAQLEHRAPDFDLIIADEAHRTTGVESESGFHVVHDNNAVRGRMRLYMTATPRVYTPKSKRAMKSRGYDVFDMEDDKKYGEVLYRLTFKDAVAAKMLSDYRVSIMLTQDDKAVQDLYDKYLMLKTDDEDGRVIKYEDVERLLGTALAINGITERYGGGSEKLPRVLGFANSRVRSKAFRDLLNMPDLHRILANRMSGYVQTTKDDEMHKVEHVDGNSSAYERNTALRNLGSATEDNPRMLCNVKLFTEGVDVPSLNAVAFLDPRDSMVDIVQAVGRVMRKSKDKTHGRIIIPVPLMDSGNITEELMAKDEWRATGRVLRALQSHDGRLPENPARFIDIFGPFGNGGVDEHRTMLEGIQDTLQFEEISEMFYAKVVASSGLAKPGQMVTDEIEWIVGSAGRVFEKSSDLDEKLAAVIGLRIDSEEYSSRDICKIAALLVINACLLHRRLQGKLDGLVGLGDINGSTNPRTSLIKAWNHILDRDYEPVFEPALEVVKALPDIDKPVRNALYRIIDRANAMADSLSELGYDHAGPLYHKILGTATSDSANYTHNVSALMLARMAFSDKFADWSDMEKVTQLRIMDPACGTGTLLMAALKTIKDRMKNKGLDDIEEHAKLHRKMVEDTICGLDINRHAVQLAACNLTLGAPTTDYKKMNLYTMKHGPQSEDSSVKAGSVEILRGVSERDPVRAFVQPLRSTSDIQARHIDSTSQTKDFPLRDLDVVIMNPPFGSNVKRGRKYPKPVVKLMQQNELAIKKELTRRDPEAGKVIDSNSIRTFFTPLADKLLNAKDGTLAKVLPVTACVTASGFAERRFLANRFHVECIITTHDPKHVNFSYKTNIHECLMICRRFDGNIKPPTEFISLRKMPENTKQAIEAADAIISGDAKKWGNTCSWPAELVGMGNWTPVQWYDIDLPEIISKLENSPLLEPLGVSHEVGPRIDGSYEKCESDEVGAVNVFESIGTNLRKTIHNTVPDAWYKPLKTKKHLAEQHWEKRSSLFIARRFRTTSTRMTALYSNIATFGTGYIHTSTKNKQEAKALSVWWNSTPVVMMLLNRRSKTLTYLAWSLDHLAEIRIPKPDNPAWDDLRTAYDKVCDMELLPLKQATEDKARIIIDKAAAKILDIDPSIIAGWRTRLAREPTISNIYAESG